MRGIVLLFTSAFCLILPRSSALANLPPNLTPELAWKGRLVVGFTPEFGDVTAREVAGIAVVGEKALDHLARRFQVSKIAQLYPEVKPIVNPYASELTRYYLLQFPESQDLHAIAEAYASVPGVVTAEPYRVHQVDYIPNDPFFTQQWYLDQVEAMTAYDYCQGSPDVIVGIVHSGIDTAHVDLRDNLWVNPGEDLNHNGIIEPGERNGIDDDGNGYIDDFWGWNVWQNNNNIQDEPGGGGSMCSGCASAVVDNGIGISSLGYKAKIMMTKAGDGVYIYNAVQGILYCAENGADIISLAYGSSFYSLSEQAVINYAWSQGAIIIASAGSNSSSQPYYPAAYNNVVAVTATDQNDHKASFATFGTWVDLCAPGVNILSTYPGSQYESWDGTGLACPLAAGLAALVKAASPSLTSTQILQQIYATCVNIDTLNPGYTGLLGHGRIDAGAALSGLFLNLTMTSPTTPVVIPPGGGTFVYTVRGSNSDSAAHNFDFWCRASFPNGAYTVPLVGPCNLTLPAAGSVARNRTQFVPDFVPAGEYLFVGFIGDYPNSICQRDTILVLVEGSTNDGGETGFKTAMQKLALRPAQTSSENPGVVNIKPNPFNPTTVASFELRVASRVSFKVYDIAGRLVVTLVDGWREAGRHQVTFDGSKLATGVYVYRLQAANFIASGKLVLLK